MKLKMRKRSSLITKKCIKRKRLIINKKKKTLLSLLAVINKKIRQVSTSYSIR